MLRLTIAVFFAFFGTTLGQIAQGIPVQHGLFIPVNTTNSRNNYPLPYPNRPVNNYPSGYSNPDPYRSAYDNRNVQPNYPPQLYNPVQSFKYPGYNNSANNQVVYGARTSGDELLFKTVVTKNVPFLRSAAIKELVYPDPSSKLRIQRITQIVLTNNRKNDNRWSNEILKGGVGREMVEFRFKSHRGLDFNLEIFGFK